ncbi:MAG TPA: hypothetical protein VEL07_03775 [Planctomycetota bacterium]|nr:hypothetical protein [Planctomycetota bacterium]
MNPVDIDLIETELRIPVPAAFRRAGAKPLKTVWWEKDAESIISPQDESRIAPLGYVRFGYYRHSDFAESFGLWFSRAVDQPVIVTFADWYGGFLDPIQAEPMDFVRRLGVHLSVAAVRQRSKRWPGDPANADLLPDPMGHDPEAEFLKTPLFARFPPAPDRWWSDFLERHRLLLERLRSADKPSIVLDCFQREDAVRDPHAWLALARRCLDDDRRRDRAFTQCETALTLFGLEASKQRPPTDHRLTLDFLTERIAPLFPRDDDWRRRLIQRRQRQLRWRIRDSLERLRKEEPARFAELLAEGYRLEG